MRTHDIHAALQHPGRCGCYSTMSLRRGIGRRGMLGLAAGAILAPRFASPARAEDGTAFDSMLLTCIDPRLVTPVASWMDGRGLKGRYSQFAIAGAPVGVVAPAFSAWHTAFWDNLGASIQLHKITRVIVVSHRDCGAAAIAYGADSIATRDAENTLHQRVYADFKAELGKRQPTMRAEGGLMALDGTIEAFA